MEISKIPALILVMLIAVIPAQAQRGVYSGRIHITPQALEQRGDSLHVRITYDITGVNVNSRYSISLTPSLAAPSQQRDLPVVIVRGRNNYRQHKREMALMGRKERAAYQAKAPYADIKGYKPKTAKQVAYELWLPFEEWMEQAQLDMREEIGLCDGTPRMLAMSQLVNRVQLEQKVVIEPYEVVPHVAYLRPAAETVKYREMLSEAFLDFEVGKSAIAPDYMNNPVELLKVVNMIAEATNDPAVTVNAITVVGYASPEGATELNRKLSERRAGALVDYLAARFDFPRGFYRTAFGGENWDGLREMIEASDMADKQASLNIIDNVPEAIDYQTNTSRKQQLMMLHGGDPYRHMLREFFPMLRKAVCRIDYQVKNFDLEEARRQFALRPQNLSLNEMYLVANSYADDSPEFSDVFETAVRMFPEDQTANLNAASAALARRDTVLAERYLARVTAPSPEADNAQGVLALLRGDHAAAKRLLESARDGGVAAAAENLRELELKQENIRILDAMKR